LRFGVKGEDFHASLRLLIEAIDATPIDAIVVTPEVALTNFDYAHFDIAAAMAPLIDEALLRLSSSRTLLTTRIDTHEGKFYNRAVVYHRGAIVHTQAKHKLFTLGREREYFAPASLEDIHLFDIDGIRVGILICFELRFTPLWERLRGADMILVPAQWGSLRSAHFAVLSQALAIANQCYVIASDSANSDCTAQHFVWAPDGTTATHFEPDAIATMRRYINTGI